jgi:hypothetical protein
MATMRSNTKISGGGAVPKLGGGGAGLQSQMFALANLGQKQGIMNEADIAKEDELAGSISNTMKNVTAQFGGNVTRGSKITRGGVTYEFNPRPNQQESADIASQSVMEPIFKDITRMLGEGYMDGPSKNPIERTMRQGIVDLGQPIFASQDERLKQLTSAFNKLKSTLPFDAGGKQLTGTEKDLVFKLLNTTGKDNATILSDMNFAMDKIRARAKLAMGGLNSVEVGPASEATAQSASPMATPSPVPGQAPASSAGRIKVVNLKTGKRGTISANTFDDKLFAKV